MTDALVTRSHIDWAERALAKDQYSQVDREWAIGCCAQALANLEQCARSVSEREIRALEEELREAKRQVHIMAHDAWEDGHAQGYIDWEKTDHGRTDVLKSPNPYPNPNPEG